MREIDRIIAELKEHNEVHHPVNNLGIIDCARCGRLPYWCHCHGGGVPVQQA